jgi:hypothetical protein
MVIGMFITDPLDRKYERDDYPNAKDLSSQKKSLPHPEPRFRLV